MRRMSLARRRVVVLASSMAAMSGVGPLLLQGHRTLQWVWIGLMLALLARVVVLMARLRRDEDCE